MLLTLFNREDKPVSSWGDSWTNSWGNSFGYTISLLVNEALHSNLADEIGNFVIPELRLVGALTSSDGQVTASNLQLVVFSGTDIYSSTPVLQTSSISVTDGQIGVKSSEFLYEYIGNDYLAVFYEPGPPIKGGGPHPATVVDSNA
jgi:hypothetical protein